MQAHNLGNVSKKGLISVKIENSTCINLQASHLCQVLRQVMIAVLLLSHTQYTFAETAYPQKHTQQEHTQIAGQAKSFQKDAIELEVIGPLVNVYLGPGSGYPIIHTLEKGETVILERQFTQWIKITSRHTVQGWIQKKDLPKIADAKGRPLTARQVPPQTAGAFSVQFAIGPTDGAMSGTGGIGYGISEQLRFDLILNHTTEGLLQGRGLLGQFSLDLQSLGHWQPYLNLGYGGYNTDGTLLNQNNFDRFKAGGGIRKHLIGGLEGTIEYSRELILISGSSNVHADTLQLGILTYF